MSIHRRNQPPRIDTAAMGRTGCRSLLESNGGSSGGLTPVPVSRFAANRGLVWLVLAGLMLGGFSSFGCKRSVAPELDEPQSAQTSDPPAGPSGHSSWHTATAEQSAAETDLTEINPNETDLFEPEPGGVADVDPPSGRSPHAVSRRSRSSARRPEQSKQAVQPVFRPSDTRPRHDDDRLARQGIFRYESARLILYTDIEPEIARTLPPIIDRVYVAWVEYFGPLPPNREGTEYQMTGYVMRDKDRFREAGLLPLNLPDFYHGRHRGAEFWMNDQTRDYYRRHLLIHEATHCFMTTMPDVRAPVWYMEGMAELFGTHTIGEDGRVAFRVMPDDPQTFAGHGRITLVNRDVEQSRPLSVREVTTKWAGDFADGSPYAWSWALCKFLDTHPRYRERFRKLGGYTAGSQFLPMFQKLFEPDFARLETDWLIFVAELQYGYDIERAVIDFEPGRPLPPGGRSEPVEIAADRGWQSGGVRVERGREYRVRASGRFALAQQPKPWISEPDGISFRYLNGKPLGLLLAWICPDDAGEQPSDGPLVSILPIGSDRQFTAPAAGTLYFRVNDSYGELHDNTGAARVQVEAATVGRQ